MSARLEVSGVAIPSTENCDWVGASVEGVQSFCTCLRLAERGKDFEQISHRRPVRVGVGSERRWNSPFPDLAVFARLLASITVPGQRPGGREDGGAHSEELHQLRRSGGGSSGGVERPAVMRGLWGNFTRMAWRNGDAATRENLAASRADIANLRNGDQLNRENLAASRGDVASLRNGDLVGRENLAVNLGNSMISQNIDPSSGKEMLFSRGENANMSFGNQQQQQHHQHILSSRPNQGDQRSERENGLKVSSFSNRIIDQMRSKTVTPSSGVHGSPFKTGLKGKGVTHQEAREEIQLQANARLRAPTPKIPSSTHDSVARLDGAFFNSGGNVSESQYEGTSLRELIKPGRQAMSKFEKMHLFKQILDLVDKSHAQGLTLQHLRPSYFIVSSPNQVKYTGSYTAQDLSAPAKPDMAADDVFNRKRCFDQKTVQRESNCNGNSILKYQKVGEQGSVAVRRPVHTFRTDHRGGNQRDGADVGASGQGNSSCTARGRFKFGEPYYGSNASYAQRLSNYGNQESVLEPRVLEDSWYRSPEELSQVKGTLPSNIYSLGVLLFEVCWLLSRHVLRG